MSIIVMLLKCPLIQTCRTLAFLTSSILILIAQLHTQAYAYQSLVQCGRPKRIVPLHIWYVLNGKRFVNNDSPSSGQSIK